jgi:quercetin dioxygenase-like cupin family protein
MSRDAASRNAGALPVELGKNVVVQKITVAPGSAIAWHQQPENTVIIITKGTLTNYVSCSEKQTWEPGKAYLELSSDKSSANLTKNEGSGPAELVAIFAQVPADQPAGSAPISYTDVPAGFPTGQNGIKVEELGRGVSYGTGKFDLDANKNVVVEHFMFEPGFTTTWHRHPDTQLIIQLKGTLINYQGCTEKEVWTPGNTYLHLNSEHHNAHAYLTRNETNEMAEIVAVFFNVPNQPQYVRGVTPTNLLHTPITPLNPPPSDCPTMLY